LCLRKRTERGFSIVCSLYLETGAKKSKFHESSGYGIIFGNKDPGGFVWHAQTIGCIGGFLKWRLPALKLAFSLADALFMANGGMREAVSLARLTALLEGDVEGSREVLRLFLEELPRVGEALREANSPKELARALHRFRGSLLSLGLRSTADYLGTLEANAQAAKVFDATIAESVCTLIPDLVEETKRELV